METRNTTDFSDLMTRAGLGIAETAGLPGDPRPDSPALHEGRSEAR